MSRGEDLIGRRALARGLDARWVFVGFRGWEAGTVEVAWGWDVIGWEGSGPRVGRNAVELSLRACPLCACVRGKV